MKLGDTIYVYIGENSKSKSYDEDIFLSIMQYFSKSKILVSNKLNFDQHTLKTRLDVYKQCVIGVVLSDLNEACYKFITEFDILGIPVICNNFDFNKFDKVGNIVQHNTINDLLSGIIFFRQCRADYNTIYNNTYNLKQDQIINKFDSSILILEYPFKEDNVYTLKINNFQSESSEICMYLYSTNIKIPIIKLNSSELSNKFQVNLNYLDTRISSIQETSFIIIKDSNLRNFSFDSLTVEEYTPQTLSSIKLLDVPDVKTYKTKQAKKKYRVACILDSFSYKCFEYELDLIPVSKTNWSQVVDSKIDFFLCESAWKGNDGEWSKELENFKSTNKRPINSFMRYLKHNKIPKVFYNKEDPVSFLLFKNFASQFTDPWDCVVTTDENMIVKYKELGCKNVISNPFCCQPVLHNPVNKVESPNREVVFPCTYYAKKYPERCREMRDIMDIFIKLGPEVLDVYDRQYVFNIQANQLMSLFNYSDYYKFPDKYTNLIQGCLTYDQVIHLYKNYKCVMNVNTVTTSGSMFSRRVMEAAACSTPVISNKSIGIEKIFGNKVVEYTDVEAVKKLLEDDDHRKLTGDILYKTVMKGFTYSKLIDRFLKFLPGLGDKVDKVNKVVCVIFLEDEVNLNNFTSFTERYDYVIVSETLMEKSLDSEDLKKLNIVDGEGIKELNLIELYDYMVILDESYTYSEDYVDNSMLPRLYTDAIVFGKGLDDEHKFTNKLDVNTLVVKLSKDMDGLFKENCLKDELKLYLQENYKENMYASDKFDYTPLVKA